MNKAITVCLAGVGLALGGCGTSITTVFANQVVAADGQPLVLDDLETIANDPNLSEEQKRQAMRDLGIEDEELIDALLDL